MVGGGGGIGGGGGGPRTGILILLRKFLNYLWNYFV